MKLARQQSWISPLPYLGILVAGGLLLASPATAQMMDDSSSERTKRVEVIRQADSYQQSGKFAEAEAAFEELIKQYPNDAVMYYKLGRALLSQGKLEAAIVSYQKAISLNSNYAVAHNGLGLAMANQGRLDEAVAEFQRALAINPNYVEALGNMGQVLWQQKKRTDALAALEKARELLQQQGRFQDVRQVDRLLQQIKTTSPDAA